MVFKYRNCYVVPRDFLTKPQASRVARAQTNVVGLRLAFSMSLPRPQYDAFWRACHHGKNAGSQSMIPSVLRFERTQLPIALELSKVCKEGEKSKRGLPGAFGQSPTPRMGSQQDVDLRLVVTKSVLDSEFIACVPSAAQIISVSEHVRSIKFNGEVGKEQRLRTRRLVWSRAYRLRRTESPHIVSL